MSSRFAITRCKFADGLRRLDRRLENDRLSYDEQGYGGSGHDGSGEPAQSLHPPRARLAELGRDVKQICDNEM